MGGNVSLPADKNDYQSFLDSRYKSRRAYVLGENSGVAPSIFTIQNIKVSGDDVTFKFANIGYVNRKTGEPVINQGGSGFLQKTMDIQEFVNTYTPELPKVSFGKRRAKRTSVKVPRSLVTEIKYLKGLK
jgi:hypothetical protein